MQEDPNAGVVGTLNTPSNFVLAGGASITQTGAGASGQIVFNGVGTQNLTANGTFTNVIDVTIASSSTLQMSDETSIIGGTGTFLLSAGATLGIRSIAGITAAGATGHVQTTTRTFSTGANYIYNGNTNQSTGSGLPATVNNLTIANTGGFGDNTVSLTSATGVSNTLSVNSGVLALGANNITTVSAINMTGTSITGTGTITLAGNVTTNASGFTASIGAPIVLSGANRTFTIADGGATPDLQISSGVSGSFGFVKAGTGLLNLFGLSTYTGPTTVNAGTLRIGSPTALGTTASGTTVNAGAAIDISGINYATAEPLTINGTGVSGGGALFNSSATGATFAGLITLGSSSIISGSTGTINISNAGTITGTGFNLTLDGAAGGTIASIIGTGSGQVIKNGTGTWTLAGGAGAYWSGTTIINAGTFLLGNPGTDQYNSTSWVVNSGAILSHGTGSNPIVNTAIITVNTGGTRDMNTGQETVSYVAGGGNIIVSGGSNPSLQLSLGSSGSGSIFRVQFQGLALAH